MQTNDDGPLIVVSVDDDHRVREAVSLLVESAGYFSCAVCCGEEFLQSGLLGSARCLITDVCMPGMTGLELQTRIRLLRPDLPVIFISGHHDEEVRQRALAGGAIGFLYKPFDAVKLLDAIGKALEKENNDVQF